MSDFSRGQSFAFNRHVFSHLDKLNQSCWSTRVSTSRIQRPLSNPLLPKQKASFLDIYTFKLKQ